MRARDGDAVTDAADALSADSIVEAECCSAGASPKASALSAVTIIVNARTGAVSDGLEHERDRHRRHERRQEVAGPVRDDDAGDPSGRGEQRALREQLLHEPAPARAERQPDGGLALAIHGARQQQVGDVRARDQQDDRRERHQHGEAGQHRGAGSAGRPPHLIQPHGTVLVFSVGGRQVAADHVEIGLHARHRAPRFSLTIDCRNAEPRARQTIAGHDRRLHHHRHPEIHREEWLVAAEGRASATPMTVNAWPLSVTTRPSTSGSPSKCRCQNRWLNTTTG